MWKRFTVDPILSEHAKRLVEKHVHSAAEKRGNGIAGSADDGLFVFVDVCVVDREWQLGFVSVARERSVEVRGGTCV